ncbi:hypothetical protein HKBW3S06_00240 [Candidatus Hakubella thermalkaliphila]|uniref:N-acetyltransferase domain-containing protein n=1 Tax=Candidatus Hakubella thermalkaliphila TaxID=2754717 RepID=A0A6V8QH90_9ACTN|nr:GNAT family N-acetyltransferase [Candidatus Hakubella thermalkaliphila]MBT9167286.1 putative acetyltransferase OgpAT [Bacillota bacterium]GFP21014.1 hypothetical protein HKBW3S06_00240 [Candidatus Hakubella thermalkaliphila]GFP43394.1 hypothetical protein HKBW3C_02524 [Candidatus Hakubella thermalkaliphila]
MMETLKRLHRKEAERVKLTAGEWRKKAPHKTNVRETEVEAPILIRPFESGDRDAVRRIFADTAYFGDPLETYFDDREMLCDYYVTYYTDYESQSCFVAEADGEVVGYIMGCLKTERQRRILRSKIVPAVLRGLLAGKYQVGRKTWCFLLRYLRSVLRGEFPHVDEERYPAHLHINVTARFRGMGAGKGLMSRYLTWLRENSIPGVHVETTTRNAVAVDFFKQFGFQLLEARTITFWHGFVEGEVKLLLFGKRL